MKFTCLCLQIILIHGINSGIVRKPPAFATPVYSDSYLPAAMQVIFHAVEQLKSVQMENDEVSSSTTIPATSPHAPGQHQPTTTERKPEVMVQTEKPIEKPLLSQEPTIAESSKEPITMNSTIVVADEKPELSGEAPDIVHATPETNHETPEVDELNLENQVTLAPEVEPSVTLNDGLESTAAIMATNQTLKDSSEEEEGEEEEEEEEESIEKKKKEPSIDSVVQEIYEIVMPQNVSRDSSEESDELNDSVESKSDKDDSREDEEYDENRYTLLGEKVSQVPRPSLSTYLRKAKIPPRCSLQKLALLYDSLSKDARKQGFAKFSGYSDEVLKTLESSAEGGIGPQLQKLLEKTMERNELTRDDAKAKIVDTLKELKEPGSDINRDLRHLVPLHFKL